MTSITAKKAPPDWLKSVNADLMEQQRLGLGMADLTVLTVPGRRSGTPRRTPLTVLHLGEARFLLEGFPGSDWVANVRVAAGAAVLSVGTQHERVHLVELDAHAALPVLQAWPARSPDGAQMMKDAGVVTDTTPAAFETLAGQCTVFRIEPMP